MKEFTSIGFTKKAHGVNGSIRLSIKDQYISSFEASDFLFLAINGRKIPYFIQKKIIDSPIRVSFENHPTRASIEGITGKEIFLPKEKIIEQIAESELVFGPYIGFRIIDTELGLIGAILDVQEFPHQEMAIVAYEGKEIYMPLHEGLIERIEEADQSIFVNLPEGLLDL